jgi:hypothetical protein
MTVDSAAENWSRFSAGSALWTLSIEASVLAGVLASMRGNWLQPDASASTMAPHAIDARKIIVKGYQLHPPRGNRARGHAA